MGLLMLIVLVLLLLLLPLGGEIYVPSLPATHVIGWWWYSCYYSGWWWSYYMSGEYRRGVRRQACRGNGYRGPSTGSYNFSGAAGAAVAVDDHHQYYEHHKGDDKSQQQDLHVEAGFRDDALALTRPKSTTHRIRGYYPALVTDLTTPIHQSTTSNTQEIVRHDVDGEAWTSGGADVYC